MTRTDFDRELSRALRESTDEASPGFTGRVLTGMGHRPRRRTRLAPALLAAAALLLVLAGLPAIRRAIAPTDAPRAASSDQRQQLLREYRALEEELEQIRQAAEEQRPILYLGGDEDFDVMFDLANYELDGSSGSSRPAALPDRG